MEIPVKKKNAKKNEEAIFPWIKVVRRKFLISFPEVENEALQLLQESIHEEFEKLLSRKDKYRARIFYRILSNFYFHFCWKIKWNEECRLKSSCVQILYYMNYVGLILSNGDALSIWCDRILSGLKSFPGDPYMMCDALLLIRNMKCKYHSAYAAILKSVVCDKSMRKPLDAECFIKEMLLFRRLKFLSKNRITRRKITFLASKVICPDDVKNWLSSLDIISLRNIQCGKVAQKLLQKKLKYNSLRKLFQVLLRNKYDEKLINPARFENAKIKQCIADRKQLKNKSCKGLKKKKNKSEVQMHKPEEKSSNINNKTLRKEQHEETSCKSKQKFIVLDNSLEENSVAVSIELQNKQLDKTSIQSNYQYSHGAELHSKEIFENSVSSLFQHSIPKIGNTKKRALLQSEDSPIETSVEDSCTVSPKQKKKKKSHKVNNELEESSSKHFDFEKGNSLEQHSVTASMKLQIEQTDTANRQSDHQYSDGAELHSKEIFKNSEDLTLFEHSTPTLGNTEKRALLQSEDLSIKTSLEDSCTGSPKQKKKSHEVNNEFEESGSKHFDLRKDNTLEQNSVAVSMKLQIEQTDTANSDYQHSDGAELHSKEIFEHSTPTLGNTEKRALLQSEDSPIKTSLKDSSTVSPKQKKSIPHKVNCEWEESKLSDLQKDINQNVHAEKSVPNKVNESTRKYEVVPTSMLFINNRKKNVAEKSENFHNELQTNVPSNCILPSQDLPENCRENSLAILSNNVLNYIHDVEKDFVSLSVNGKPHLNVSHLSIYANSSATSFHVNKIKEKTAKSEEMKNGVQDYINTSIDMCLDSSLKLFQNMEIDNSQQLSAQYQNSFETLEPQLHNLDFEMIALLKGRINITQKADNSVKDLQHNSENISKINCSDHTFQSPMNKLSYTELSLEPEAKLSINQSNLDIATETNGKKIFVCDVEKTCDIHVVAEKSLTAFLSMCTNGTGKRILCTNNKHCKCSVCSYSTHGSAGCNNEELPKSHNSKLNMDAQMGLVNGIQISTASMFPIVNLGKRCDETESMQNLSILKYSYLTSGKVCEDSHTPLEDSSPVSPKLKKRKMSNTISFELEESDYKHSDLKKNSNQILDVSEKFVPDKINDLAEKYETVTTAALSVNDRKSNAIGISEEIDPSELQSNVFSNCIHPSQRLPEIKSYSKASERDDQSDKSASANSMSSSRSSSPVLRSSRKVRSKKFTVQSNSNTSHNKKYFPNNSARSEHNSDNSACSRSPSPVLRSSSRVKAKNFILDSASENSACSLRSPSPVLRSSSRVKAKNFILDSASEHNSDNSICSSRSPSPVLRSSSRVKANNFILDSASEHNSDNSACSSRSPSPVLKSSSRVKANKFILHSASEHNSDNSACSSRSPSPVLRSSSRVKANKFILHSASEHNSDNSTCSLRSPSPVLRSSNKLKSKKFLQSDSDTSDNKKDFHNNSAKFENNSNNTVCSSMSQSPVLRSSSRVKADNFILHSASEHNSDNSTCSLRSPSPVLRSSSKLKSKKFIQSNSNTSDNKKYFHNSVASENNSNNAVCLSRSSSPELKSFSKVNPEKFILESPSNINSGKPTCSSRTRSHVLRSSNKRKSKEFIESDDEKDFYNNPTRSEKNSSNTVCSSRSQSPVLRPSSRVKANNFILHSASEHNSDNSTCSSRSPSPVSRSSSKRKSKKFIESDNEKNFHNSAASENNSNYASSFSRSLSSDLGSLSKVNPDKFILESTFENNCNNSTCSSKSPSSVRRSPRNLNKKGYPLKSDRSLPDVHILKNKIQKPRRKYCKSEVCWNEKSQVQPGALIESSISDAHCSSVGFLKCTPVITRQRSSRIKNSKKFIECNDTSSGAHVPENKKEILLNSCNVFINHSDSPPNIEPDISKQCSIVDLNQSIYTSKRQSCERKRKSSKSQDVDPELNSCRSSASNSDNLIHHSKLLLNNSETNKSNIDEEFSSSSFSDTLENQPLTEIRKVIQNESINSIKRQKKLLDLSEKISDSSLNQSLCDNKSSKDLITIKRKQENVKTESSPGSTSDSSENISLLALQKKLNISNLFPQNSTLTPNSDQVLEKNSNNVCIQEYRKISDSSENLYISKLQKKQKNNSNSSTFKKVQNSALNLNLEQPFGKHSDGCIEENGMVSDENFPNLNLSNVLDENLPNLDLLLSDFKQENTWENFSFKEKNGLSKNPPLSEIDKNMSNSVISETEKIEGFLLDSNLYDDRLLTVMNNLKPNMLPAEANSFMDNHLDSSNNGLHKFDHVVDYVKSPVLNNSPSLKTVTSYNDAVNEHSKQKSDLTYNRPNINTVDTDKENLTIQLKDIGCDVQDYVNDHRDTCLDSSLELFQNIEVDNSQLSTTQYQNSNENFESQSHKLKFEMDAAFENRININQNSEISLKELQPNTDNISKINYSDYTFQSPLNKLSFTEMSVKPKEKLVNQSNLDDETNEKILFLCDVEKKTCEVHVMPEKSLFTFLNKSGNVTEKQTLCTNNNHCNCPVCSYSSSVSASCNNEEAFKNDSIKFNKDAQMGHIFVNGIKLSTASLFPVVYLGKRCDETESIQRHNIEKKTSLLTPVKINKKKCHSTKRTQFASLNSNSENLAHESYHRKEALKSRKSDLCKKKNSLSKPKSARNSTHVPYQNTIGYNLRCRNKLKP